MQPDSPRRRGPRCNPTRTSRRTLRAATIVVALVLFNAAAANVPVPIPTTRPPAARASAGPVCRSGRPDGDAYTVDLCLGTPDEGPVLHGDALVRATVNVSGPAPALESVVFFYARGPAPYTFEILLQDSTPPFEFQWPTDVFGDDTNYHLSAKAIFNGYQTRDNEAPILDVQLSNGLSAAQSGGTWTPKTGRSGSPFVVGVVGDGAGGLPGANDVANLIGGWNPNLFLYLGDVYNSGTYTEFQNYYRPTLGRFDGIADPVVGNHEMGSQLRGFYQYWDADSSDLFYSFDAGGWHFVALNSNTGSDQTQLGKLASDLQKHQGDCTILYYHHPRWMSLSRLTTNPWPVSGISRFGTTSRWS